MTSNDVEGSSAGIQLRVIGRIRTPFTEASGTPVQSSYSAGHEGRVVVDEAFAEVCRQHGLDWARLLPELKAQARYHVETY